MGGRRPHTASIIPDNVSLYHGDIFKNFPGDDILVLGGGLYGY